MPPRLVSITSVAAASFMLASSAIAQSASAGSRDANGRILTKVVVTMNEPGAFGRPATGLTFLVVADDGDRISMRTNDAGVASAWLPPGEYRFVTPDPLDWEGYAYTWDRMIPVRPGMGVIKLTQDEARSIALSAAAQNSRTSEPVFLSSTVLPYKTSVPQTEDLRVQPTAVKPNATQPVAKTILKAETPARVEEPKEQPTARVTTLPARRARSGMWFNIGTGYGVATCDACSDYYNGLSGGLSFGGTINPHLRLGIGTTGWYKSLDGVAMSTGTLDARLRFYPGTTGGFFITGGVGVGSVSMAVAGEGSATEFGVGALLGLGWDVPVSNGVSLTPFWNGFAVTLSDGTVSAGQIGLGFTIH